MRNLIKSGIRRLTGTNGPSPRPVGDRHATVIAVATQKGGVGKTTTSVNLAAALARFHDKKVLLLDLDPQGHVARALQAQARPGHGGLSQVLLDEERQKEVLDVVSRTDVPNLSITPPDEGLKVAEDLLASRIGKEFILRDALRITRTWYDVIIIDCPPNLGNLSLNGLVAADQVLIPCDPSPLAVSGVDGLLRTIQQVAGRLNPEIDVMGILMTRVDGRNSKLNNAVAKQISEAYGDATLPVAIGVNSSLAKAQNEGCDIFDFDPDGRGAKQYRALSDYVVSSVLEA